MSAVRLTFLRILISVTILCYSAGLYAQLEDNATAMTGEQVIDTSDYIPTFFTGALEVNLMIAASKGYASEIDRLIGEGADINAESDEGATPLIFAVSNNRLAAVEALLKYNPRLNEVAPGNDLPLFIAVKNRNFEITEALLRGGAEADRQDRHEATPLHYSSVYGYLEIVDLLLYYDANIDIKSEDGSTPLLASIWAGNADVSDLLIQNGANMEARDNKGFTPFLMASFTGDTLMMDLLYKNRVDIYAVNNSKHNALTLAIIADHRVVTEYLLRIGDKWTNSGKDANDPYSVAAKYRRKEMVNILKTNNIPGSIRYEIDQVALTLSSRFVVFDFHTGFSIAFKEPYLNGGFITGFDTKPGYSRVLVKDSEHVYHQYMDKGSLVYAGLFKDFSLTDRPVKSNFLVSTSLLASYSFGNKLKGTLIYPENKFMVIPAISLKWTNRNLALSIGAEYLKSDYYRIGPVWMRIGFSYTYFFDKIRTKNKTKNWY